MMAPPGYPKTTSTLSATRASQIVCAPVLFIGLAFSERGKKRAPRPFGAGLVLAGILLGQNGGPHPSPRRPRRLRLRRTRAPASAAETTSTLRGLRSIPFRCRAEWRDVSSSLLYFTEISRFVPGERSSSGVQDRLRDLRDSLPMGALCEHDGAGTSHPPSVGLHYRKICADQRREVGLVDHEEVRQRDSGPALARHLVPSGDVDHIDGVVGELAAVLRGEVVAAALDEEKPGGGPHLLHQLFESEEVVADVLADGGVRAAAGLDGADPCFGQRLVAHQELGVLAGEDVVRHHSQGDAIPKLAAEGEEERGLAASDGSADADGERPQRVVARERPPALVEVAGVAEMIVIVSVVHLLRSLKIGRAASTSDRASLRADRRSAPSARDRPRGGPRTGRARRRGPARALAGAAGIRAFRRDQGAPRPGADLERRARERAAARLRWRRRGPAARRRRPARNGIAGALHAPRHAGRRSPTERSSRMRRGRRDLATGWRGSPPRLRGTHRPARRDGRAIPDARAPRTRGARWNGRRARARRG